MKKLSEPVHGACLRHTDITNIKIIINDTFQPEARARKRSPPKTDQLRNTDEIVWQIKLNRISLLKLKSKGENCSVSDPDPHGSA